MTVRISDNAEEFRIEIVGPFQASSVKDARTAWEAALMVNVPRRISVDITRMTSYDHDGFMLLREMHAHGTHIGAGTPASLRFLTQISSPLRPSRSFLDDVSRLQRRTATRRVSIQPHAAASGE